jgi:hypothetical protein
MAALILATRTASSGASSGASRTHMSYEHIVRRQSRCSAAVCGSKVRRQSTSDRVATNIHPQGCKTARPLLPNQSSRRRPTGSVRPFRIPRQPHRHYSWSCSGWLWPPFVLSPPVLGWKRPNYRFCCPLGQGETCSRPERPTPRQCRWCQNWRAGHQTRK